MHPSDDELETAFEAASIDPATAVAAFGYWLTSREQRSGPFGAHYGPEPMHNLVGQFCKAQGWPIDPNQDVSAIIANYPVD